MKRMPSAYAWPVVPTSVIALNCVANTDSPTAHQGRLRLASRYPSPPLVPLVRLNPSATIQNRYAAMTIQSSGRMKGGPAQRENVRPNHQRRVMTAACQMMTRVYTRPIGESSAARSAGMAEVYPPPRLALLARDRPLDSLRSFGTGGERLGDGRAETVV